MKRLFWLLLLVGVLALGLSSGVSAGGPLLFSPQDGVLMFTSMAGDAGTDPDGTGTGNLAFDLANLEVCYTLLVNDITLPANAAHIHRVSDNGIEVGLSAPDAGGFASGCTSISQAQYDAIVGDPSAYYINVHNDDFPGGAIDGTLNFVEVLTTSLTGEQTDTDYDGAGGGAFAFYPSEGAVCYDLGVSNIVTATVAHIHTGGVNEDGGPVVTLTAPTDFVSECVSVDETTQNDILGDPAAYYVNVHNADFPGGAVRGQLGATTLLHATTLGLNEVSSGGAIGAGDADGYGLTVVTIDMGTGELCYDMSVSNVTNFTAAHIHTGAAGVNGGVLVGLSAPDNGTGLASGCLAVDSTVLQDILFDPSAYYVNVHNSQFPAGAVRGQLEAYQTFTATLSGQAEVDGGDPDATGYALVHISANDNNICYTLNVNDIAAASAAHIHTGVAGVNGGIVVPLATPDAGGDVTACDDSQSLETLAGIAAAPWAHYVNVHNDDFPGGAVRGQLNVYEVFTAVMTGDQEVPGPGDDDGFGVGTFAFNYGNNTLCSILEVQNIETSTAAHIHPGAAGVSGGVYIPLPTPDASGNAAECMNPSQALMLPVLEDPEGYYANVHNASFSAGAIRGQLTQFPVFPSVPQAFNLLSPPDGLVVYDLGVLTQVTWEESVDAETYRWVLFQLSTNSRLGVVFDLTGLTPADDGDDLTCTGGVCTLSLDPSAVETLSDGIYSWTVEAQTLLATVEAGNAPFFLTVASDGVELVVNGSFESGADGWTVKNATADKVKCNKDKDGDGIDDKIFAHSGNCAWQFKGSNGENSKILQNVDLTGITTSDTATLSFSAFVRGNANASKGKAKIRVAYVDESLEKGKITIELASTNDYEMIGDVLALTGEARKIKVQFVYKGSSGKLLVDTVSLQLGTPVDALSAIAEPVPLPDAPSDFRSGN